MDKKYNIHENDGDDEKYNIMVEALREIAYGHEGEAKEDLCDIYEGIAVNVLYAIGETT